MCLGFVSAEDEGPEEAPYFLQHYVCPIMEACLKYGNRMFILREKNIWWGSIAALFSPIPYIGTTVVWIPIVIFLLITKHWIAALFLTIWSMFVVGTVDNFVKPYLIGSSTALHPLAVLLVILGGAFAFGLKGLIFGPFILTLTLAFLHIYRLEFEKELDGRKK